MVSDIEIVWFVAKGRVTVSDRVRNATSEISTSLSGCKFVLRTSYPPRYSSMATYGRQRRRGREAAATPFVFQDNYYGKSDLKHCAIDLVTEEIESAELSSTPGLLPAAAHQPLLTSKPTTISCNAALAADAPFAAARALPMSSISTSHRYRSLSLPRKVPASNKTRIDEAHEEFETLPAVPQLGSAVKRDMSKFLLDKSTNRNMARGREQSGRTLEISGPYDVVKGDLPADLTSAIAAHKKFLPSRLAGSTLPRPISPPSRSNTSTDPEFLSIEYQHTDTRSSPITTYRSPSKGRRILAKRSERLHTSMSNDAGFFSRVKDAISRSFSSSSSQGASHGHLQATPSYANLPEEITLVQQSEDSSIDRSSSKLHRHYGYAASKSQSRTRSVGIRGNARDTTTNHHTSGDTTMQTDDDFSTQHPQTILGNSHGAYDGFAAWATEEIRAIGTDSAEIDRITPKNGLYHKVAENHSMTHLGATTSYTNSDDYLHCSHLTTVTSANTGHNPTTSNSVVTSSYEKSLHIPFLLHTPGGSLELHHTNTPGVDFAHFHYKKDDDAANKEANKGCLCQQRAAQYLDTEVSQLADFDHSLGPVSSFSCANSPFDQHPNVLKFAEPPEWYKMSMKTRAIHDLSRSSTAYGHTSLASIRAQLKEGTSAISSLPLSAYPMLPGRHHVQASTPTIPLIHVNRASDNSKRGSGDAEICGNSPQPGEWKKGKTFVHAESPPPTFQMHTPYCDEMESCWAASGSNSRGVSFDTSARDIVMRTSDDSFSALLLDSAVRNSNDSFNQWSARKLKRPSTAYRKSMPMYLRPSTEMDIDDIDELSVDQPDAIGLAK